MYEGWGALGQSVSAGNDAYQDAKKAKALAERQAKQDAMAQEEFQMKKSEQTPSFDALPGLSVPPGVKLTRGEAVKGAEKLAEIAAAKKAAADAKRAAGGGNMNETPGRKAADQAFGKEYVDFNSTGLPTIEKGLGTLREARQELRDKGQDLTGPTRGAVPDFIRAYTNPEAVGLKERIRGAVQSTLKQTLGAQFTEKEGERIFNNAYNDRLSPEENITRLDSVIKELTGQKESKQNMGQYFEDKGTLTGFKQPTPVPESKSSQRLKSLGL